ncbi:helix-turn-helix transcriptional regulator [Leucobacter sp. HY1910]
MDVQDLLELAAKHPTATSRRSGVSRATINRLRKGDGEPSLGTLSELAAALGLAVEVRVNPSGDPYAAIAARVLLDPEMDAVVRPAVLKWLKRFERYGIAKDPEHLVETAGRLSAPQHHPDARFFAPRRGLDSFALGVNAASAGGSDSVVSGAPAAALLLDREVRGATILWSTDPDGASEAMRQTLVETSRFQPAGVVIAPAPRETLIDPLVVQQQRFASPIQTVLDLHGLGMVHLAREITKEWGKND